MGNVDWMERLKAIFKNRDMVKVVSLIVAAIVVVVSVFAIVPRFFSSEKEEVVVNKTEMEENVEEAAIDEEVAEKENTNSDEMVDYAAVFMVTINPNLKIYVDKDSVVVKMEALNADAETLLETFKWENKKLENCFTDLLDKAHEDGFLRNNAMVKIVAQQNWNTDEKIDMIPMLQSMEAAVTEVCEKKALTVKVLMQEQETEDAEAGVVMEKEITGKAENEEVNNALPTGTLADELVMQGAMGEQMIPVSDKKEEPQKTPASTDDNDDSSSEGGNTSSGGTSGAPVNPSGYKLVWEDNFNGTQLNRDDWNVELHAPGWVNAEWQEYVDSEENIYLKDGKLVLQAIKTTKNGKDYYTSGRINTQNKHDFKYGKFEAKVKVPSGMGFLPAFWMMPTDEQNYGQWPKCGEIDIMEVMGQSTDTLHGTIHYGDPHGQKQGTYVIDASKSDFAEDFHVYTCEWEPGKISWFVDGIKFHEATDWYTKREGFDEVAYPAPFDQPFYMIFNVAVGGSWVGYPDETTEFGDNAQMVVDYVRVYQKDSYNENVQKPAKPEVPDSEIGANLLVNGEFTNNEAFDDGKDWEFLTANGGEGTAQIVDVDGNNTLKIATANAGTVDYSVQLVQGPIALKQGNKYKVSFEAWADEARTMKALISAPDLNYIRYWGDQTVNLTTQKQQFTYEFDMTEAGDANSRFEMTFGAMGSTAAVYIDNIKVEKTDSFEIEEEGKTVLPDGNYVYNSGFDTGADRMQYWSVDSKVNGASYCATNTSGVREFKAVVPGRVSSLEDVVLKQEDIALSGGKKYLFTFDAYGAEAKTMKAVIAPNSSAGNVEELGFDAELTTAKTGYEFTFTLPEGVAGADVKFLLGAAGTTYIDNVRVQEDANVINGDFTSGTAGWELYAYTPGDVVFAIDELDNKSGTPAAALNITKSGPVDWHIQLKQPVTLEQGKKYRVSFDTWSTVERNFLFAIQRNADKKGDSDWISYSGDINETMSTNGFKHYSKEFDMTWKTDDIAELKFTLGAVGGVEINTPHTVFIDNVVLEEIGTCEVPDGSDEPIVVEGENMFTNPNFDGMDGWVVTWDSQWDPNNADFTATASTTVENNTLIYDITNVGKNDYSIQLKQEGIDFEEGATYKASFDVSSTAARNIKFALMGAGDAWYAGKDAIAVSEETTNVSFEFKPSDGKDSYEDLTFQLSLGKVDDNTPTSTLTFANMKLVKLETQEPEAAQPVNVTLSDISLVKSKDENGNEVTDGSNLVTGEWIGAYTTEDGKMRVTVTDPKTNPWDVQLQQVGINLEANCEYELSFKGSADAAKFVQVGVQQNGGSYAVYSLEEGKDVSVKLGADEKSYTNVFTMNATGDDNATLFINLGNITEQNAGYILAADGEQQETPEEGGNTPDAPVNPVEGNLFERGSFSAEDTAYVDGGTNIWDFWTAYAADGSASLSGDTAYNDGCMTVSIANEGSANYGIQLKYAPKLTLENGANYTLSFDATSSVARGIISQFQDSNYNTVGWNMSNLAAGETKQITVNFQYNGETSSDYNFCINMGKMDGADAIGTAHTITFDNFTLVKVSDAEPIAEMSLMSLRNTEELPEVEETTEESVTEETTENESTEETSETETTTEESTTEEETTTTEESSEETSTEDAFVETKTEEEEEGESVTETDENVPSESVQN